MKGIETGNPFIDSELSAVISKSEQNKEVPEFNDGDGIFRIRFRQMSR